jgi:hypothetical protein
LKFAQSDANASDRAAQGAFGEATTIQQENNANAWTSELCGILDGIAGSFQRY